MVGCMSPQPTCQAGERDAAAATDTLAELIRKNYTKREYRVPMRDGVRLFTAVYTPKDTAQHYPLLMRRTPYGCSPYGQDRYPATLGPSRLLVEARYIFVVQDVRGSFMSEGDFVNMTPHVSVKSTDGDIDESTDTYDTIEWLIANVPHHNGSVGMWGISYPGFYAAAGMIDAHPALKAVSPQAPIADWFFDDFHHHGAFFLPDAVNFFCAFGRQSSQPTTEWGEAFDYDTPDGYQFYLDLGPLKNINQKYFHGRREFWNRIVEHPDYDEFWQARNILPHLKAVAPAVMTVGGWFDAEDLYGPLATYRAVERQNPDVFNVLVMGPWFHGGWGRSEGERLGNIEFGDRTSLFYRRKIELAFFDHYLKGRGDHDLPEAYVFETGANRWRTFDRWPPQRVTAKSLYLGGGGQLSYTPPTGGGPAWDEYVSDPAKPVPFTEQITTRVPKAFMTADQRFAARRPDVLVYQTEVLSEDLTVAGPILADLWVSTSGTDADWVVKLVDVYPLAALQESENGTQCLSRPLGGYQMLVRAEVIRGRYRNSYEHPEPFVQDQPTRVKLPLQDVLHTFKRGHRLMVQIQSTWFPMVDRNPQKYVDNIFAADATDFVKATHRIHRSPEHPTRLQISVLAPTTGR